MRRKMLRAALATAVAIMTIGVPHAADAATSPIKQTGQVRIAGADRYKTAVEISRRTFSAPQANVVIASGENFPDALAAGPVAAKLGAPVLLVRKGSLPAVVADELRRLHPSKVYVLGGPGVISDAVALRAAIAAGSNAYRLSGPDRYSTAAEAATLLGSMKTVYLASGESFADALAGGAAAAKQSAPILLTRTKSLPASTRNALRSLKPSKVVVLGGRGAVSAGTIAQVRAALPKASVAVHAGKDRYETAALLAKAVWPSGSRAVFQAPGTNFPDALGGAAAAKVNDAPILLTHAACLPAAAASAIKTLKATTQVALGGSTVTYLGNTTCGSSPAPATSPTPKPAPKPTPTPTPTGPELVTVAEVVSASCIGEQPPYLAIILLRMTDGSLRPVYATTNGPRLPYIESSDGQIIPIDIPCPGSL